MHHKPKGAALSQCSRRTFLRSAASLAATLPFLTSCKSSDRQDLILALGWVPNVEYADLWVALEKGYFTQEQVAMKVWPGGPNAPQPVIEVAARQAHIGEAEWLPLLDACLRGNDFVIIGSIFPVHPAALMSLPRRPVRRPADLPHARFLVQGPSERTAIEAMFKLNHLPPDYQLIPVGFSPEALLNGAGDAYYCFITNQPLMLEDMGMRPGVDFIVTRLDQFGYKVPSTLLFVDRPTLHARRTELVGLLKGRLRGKAANDLDPAYAARLAVDKFGADLGLTFQHELRTNQLQLPLYQTPGSPGPFWISEHDLVNNMYGAASAAGRTNLPDPSRLMDMSLLQEAYQSLAIERKEA
jgi:ABC-type nitrate/sulfonate/bicarbonate transport system substrate-binding protein